MAIRGWLTRRSHVPDYVIERAADGDRHALTMADQPMPSARLMLTVTPLGRVTWSRLTIYRLTRKPN